MTRVAIALSLVAFLAGTAQAQTNGGAAKPAAPTPRTADGKPDFNGRWGGGGGGGAAGGVQAIEPNGTTHEFEHYSDYSAALAAGKVSAQAKLIGRQPNYRHGNNVYSERDAGLNMRAFGNPPLYKPEHWERVQYLDENGNKEDSNFSCFPPGVPRLGPPMRMIQGPKDIVLMYQNRNSYRVIPIDGRGHDEVVAQDQTFNGSSIGKWEGDTLVVEVVGRNDVTWLGWPGWFHTNNVKIEERFTRNGNILNYQVTVYDPEVLMEPWKMDPRALPLNTSDAPFLEDPPCLELDLDQMLTRERG